jgi:hypothetical protein
LPTVLGHEREYWGLSIGSGPVWCSTHTHKSSPWLTRMYCMVRRLIPHRFNSSQPKAAFLLARQVLSDRVDEVTRFQERAYVTL